MRTPVAIVLIPLGVRRRSKAAPIGVVYLHAVYLRPFFSLVPTSARTGTRTGPLSSNLKQWVSVNEKWTDREVSYHVGKVFKVFASWRGCWHADDHLGHGQEGGTSKELHLV